MSPGPSWPAPLPVVTAEKVAHAPAHVVGSVPFPDDET
jgi:hypothetical protein